MKGGVGRVEGWVVDHRLTDEIAWKQTHGKRKAAVWKVGLGGGKTGYEMGIGVKGKVQLFKGAGSFNRALAAAKRYMEKHPRT